MSLKFIKIGFELLKACLRVTLKMTKVTSTILESLPNIPLV